MALRSLPILIFCALLALTAAAQQPHPCGSTGGRSAWLQAFQRHELTLAARGDSLQLNVHSRLLAEDDGSAAFPFRRYLETIGALEQQLEGTGIRVAVVGQDTISDSAFNVHDDVLDGAAAMARYNLPAGLNMYFLNDPAGNCGYNLPYGGVTVKRDRCSGAGSTTLAHEVGHALSLPHPFIGWEGGQSYDGSVPADFDNPAPPQVTYDYTYFKDTLILDTLIVDTALVELVDGSNCAEAADGFCDTPPDYVAQRWTCDANGESVTQTDPNGERFQSDGSLIMSYANDACHSRFSPEQQAAMRAFARDQRSEWVADQIDTATVDGASDALLDGVDLDEGQLVTFSAVPGATHYYVEASSRSSFGLLAFSGVVRDTSLTVTADAFDVGRRYFYRVYAYRNNDHRAGFGRQGSFTMRAVSSIGTPFVQAVRLAPNPVPAGGAVTVELSERTRITITAADGRRLSDHVAHRGEVTLPAPGRVGTFVAHFRGLSSGHTYARRLVVTPN